MQIDEIKRLIVEQGRKQSEVAAHLGLTQVQLSKSLTGYRRFNVHEMDALRALLRSGENNGPLRTLPIIGIVAAGNWREAVQAARDVMPSPDPRIPPKAFGLEVVGDSMDLLVEEGGYVVVDPDDKALYPDRYYVIQNADGEATFKQFKVDPARLIPCSTNPVHKEIAIGGAPFDVIGRVIWRSTRM